MPEKIERSLTPSMFNILQLLYLLFVLTETIQEDAVMQDITVILCLERRLV